MKTGLRISASKAELGTSRLVKAKVLDKLKEEQAGYQAGGKMKTVYNCTCITFLLLYIVARVFRHFIFLTSGGAGRS